MSNRGFIVVEFSDGIQVIPRIWLQSEDVCKYPSHFKTDLRLRKAIEKEKIPNSDWPSFKINRIFGEYCKYFNKIAFIAVKFYLFIILNVYNIFSVLTEG